MTLFMRRKNYDYVKNTSKANGARYSMSMLLTDLEVFKLLLEAVYVTTSFLVCYSFKSKTDGYFKGSCGAIFSTPYA